MVEKTHFPMIQFILFFFLLYTDVFLDPLNPDLGVTGYPMSYVLQ